MSAGDLRAAIATVGILALLWRFRLHGGIEPSWGYILLSTWLAQYLVQLLSTGRSERQVHRPAEVLPSAANSEEQVWPPTARSLVRSLGEAHGDTLPRVEASYFAPDEQGELQQVRSSQLKFGSVIAGVLTLFWLAPSLNTASVLVGWITVAITAVMAGSSRAKARRLGSEISIANDAVTVTSPTGATRLRFGRALRVVYQPLFGRWEIYRLDSPNSIFIDTARDRANEILGQFFRRANLLRTN